MPFDNWKHVYDNYSDELQKLALQKMSKCKRSLEEWISLYDNNEDSVELETLALEKINKYKRIFDDWKYIYEDSSGRLEKLILEKMSKVAKTFEDENEQKYIIYKLWQQILI